MRSYRRLADSLDGSQLFNFSGLSFSSAGRDDDVVVIFHRRFAIDMPSELVIQKGLKPDKVPLLIETRCPHDISDLYDLEGAPLCSAEGQKAGDVALPFFRVSTMFDSSKGKSGEILPADQLEIAQNCQEKHLLDLMREAVELGFQKKPDQGFIARKKAEATKWGRAVDNYGRFSNVSC